MSRFEKLPIAPPSGGGAFTGAALAEHINEFIAAALSGHFDEDLPVGAEKGLLRSRKVGDDIHFCLYDGTSEQVLFVYDAASGAITSPQIDAAVRAIPGRNLVTNGAMTVAQEGVSFTGQTGGGYFIEMFEVVGTDDATWTYSQSTDAPDAFAKSFKAEVTTADGGNDVSDYALIRTKFEGQNLQHLKKGTADALSFTVSFWVKASLAGTYVLHINDSDNSRHIAKTYTVDAADTWEFKTLTFAGDTSGVFTDDATESLRVEWYIGAGTDYTSGSLPAAWATNSNANRAAGQGVHLPTVLGGTFQITGVQVEVGEVSTAFEHENYGVTLAKCQRYFQLIGGFENGSGESYASLGMAAYAHSSSEARVQVSMPVKMRDAPSVSVSAAGHFRFTSGGTDAVISTFSVSDVTNEAALLKFNGSGWTTGYGGSVIRENLEASSIYFDARL